MAATLPLKNVRVANFGWVWAGPVVGQTLGFLGAEVYKVESRSRIDINRTLPPFAEGVSDPDRSLQNNAGWAGNGSITINLKEPDGLALSSRNAYLSPEERTQAVVLSQAVAAARRHIEQGEQQAQTIVETMQAVMAQAADARVQYAEVVSVETVQPVEQIEPGQEVLAAVAVFFGSTRLIDNAFIRAPEA